MSRNKDNYNQYMREYMKRAYEKRKRYIHERLGERCAKCGCTVNLQIDHVNYSDKSFNISKLWSLSLQTLEMELIKCQLLCDNCHLAKTLNEGSLNDYVKENTCVCGKSFGTIKAYAGHKRWCNN